VFRKLFVINLSLSVAAVLAAIWLAEIWQGPLGTEAKASPVAPKRISREEYSFEKMGAGSGYDLMVDRDLFRPDRRRYFPPEPSPTKTSGDEANKKGKPNLEVIGIMILSDRVKYAIVAEKPVKKIKAKKIKDRSRRRSRRKKKTPKPKPTPSDLLKPRSYREGEEVKDGWYVAEIRHRLVVFSNGDQSFEVAVLKSKIPDESEEEREGKDKRGKRPTKQLGSPFSTRKPPSPPDKDEATQRFLDALKKAGKKK